MENQMHFDSEVGPVYVGTNYDMSVMYCQACACM